MFASLCLLETVCHPLVMLWQLTAPLTCGRRCPQQMQSNSTRSSSKKNIYFGAVYIYKTLALNSKRVRVIQQQRVSNKSTFLLPVSLRAQCYPRSLYFSCPGDQSRVILLLSSCRLRSEQNLNS